MNNFATGRTSSTTLDPLDSINNPRRSRKNIRRSAYEACQVSTEKISHLISNVVFTKLS